MLTAIIISTSMQAQQLCGKPLADLDGLPVGVQVAQQVLRTRCTAAVFVTLEDALNSASRTHLIE